MSETTPGAGFSTLAIHAGAQLGQTTWSRFTPVHQSFPVGAADEAGALPGLRPCTGNPASTVLEERIAALEGGTAALAVASGRAALMIAFLTLLQPGDEFVAARRRCSGPVDPFERAFRSFGWSVRWADATKPESFVEALSDKTKAIFVETITDSGCVNDLEAIAAIARRARVPFIVDNTLTTPYLVRPFEHGADIIVHSAARFLGGNGNARGGLIVDGGSFSFAGDARYPVLSSPSGNGVAIAETFGNFAFAVGARGLGLHDIEAALSPADAVLILNGIETLALRMQRQCDNALAVARHLARHPKVTRVHYAGLEGDICHALAQRYCPKGAGVSLAFDIGSREAALALSNRLQLFLHAAAVGDTRSLVVHPAPPHDQPAGKEWRVGAASDLVRVSIGLEDVADIIADLDQALS